MAWRGVTWYMLWGRRRVSERRGPQWVGISPPLSSSTIIHYPTRAHTAPRSLSLCVWVWCACEAGRLARGRGGVCRLAVLCEVNQSVTGSLSDLICPLV
mmetsp:Transcript_49374/g.123781  ORF Transcript_49374/g.123781 Transcript_49374/m.123781 type:complete len:99 (-) Transcript_49374:991-1287(-)